MKHLLNQYFVVVILSLVVLSSCSNRESENIENGEDWSFVVFSDLQQGYGVYGRLAEIIGKTEPPPLASVCCGDIMLRPANEAEWLSFQHFSQPITDRMPLYIARGNHEGNDPVCETLLHELGNVPGPPFYYLKKLRNSIFLILDTEIKGDSGAIINEQLIWIENVLDSATGDNSIQNIFIFMHHPLYQQGKHQGIEMKNAAEIHQLFLQHQKIRAVFAGHDHMFHKMRKDGILYVITGGGGGDLENDYGGDYHHFVKVSFFGYSQRINIKTIGIFYEVVEDFDI